MLALLCAFVFAGLWYFVTYAGVDGDDLSSSYIGCRLVAAGQTSHLYAHDPKNFAAVGPDDPWQHAADAGGYQAFLHPYVQTPLWAYSLLPLCRHTSWRQFERVFAALALLSFAAIVALVARRWAPLFLNPWAMLALLVVLWFFEPFQYSMTLMQTHVFFVLAMLGAVMLAQRRRPALAGLLLAVAITVKITPAVLVLYWLVRRQWRPAVATAGWLVSLWLLTRVVAGPQLVETYRTTLDRISHTLLLSFNNQSLAAWWMDHFHGVPPESFEPLHLPDSLRIISSALLAITAIAGGWLDRRNESRAAAGDGASVAPLGALVATVGATTFAPLEWTHYSIVLIAPLMVLVQRARDSRQAWLLYGVGAVLLLNLPPLAVDPYAQALPRWTLLRSHFFGEVLCLATLMVSSFQADRQRRELL